VLSALLALLSFACPETWAYAPDAPAVEDTEACVRTYVESVYGRDLDPGSIEMDVPAGAGDLMKLSREQLAHARDTLGAVCSGCTTDTCDHRDLYCLRFAAASRLFERELAARASTVDSSTGSDIAPLIASIAKGEALDNRRLQVEAGRSKLSPLSLWRLRNAVFARHGRKFQNPELSDLFYGKGGCCKEQPDFSPGKLSKVDHANVKLITDLEKHKVGSTVPSAPKVDGKNMIPVPKTKFMRACASQGYEGACASDRPDGHHAIPTTVDAFLIDKYEVTTGDYRSCVKAKVCEPPRFALGQEKGLMGEIVNAEKNLCNWNQKNDEHPENCVSAGQAQVYCEWLGKRLPTAAEWELAARGPRGELWPTGATAPSCKVANLAGEGTSMMATVEPCRKGTVPVTKLEASPLGVVGMAGNVKEWTMDLGPKDPRGQQARIRVARGGGWRVYSNLFLRSEAPMVGELGFRCAASAP
jgi:formylglycine-generating enzyme required for sulfatase activity